MAFGFGAPTGGGITGTAADVLSGVDFSGVQPTPGGVQPTPFAGAGAPTRPTPFGGGLDKTFDRDILDIIMRKFNPNVGGTEGIRQPGAQIPGGQSFQDMGRLALPDFLRGGRGLLGNTGEYNTSIPQFLR